MINYNVFKDGKKNILTMSYDDSNESDKRLAALFDKYGIRGTFNVHNGGDGHVQADEYPRVYKNHEVAVHTVAHPYLEMLPAASQIAQIMENRRFIEKATGYVVRGMAYPFGTYNDEVINSAKACGIVYSRTVENTFSFKLPQDFMKWHPTCHHKDAEKYAERFLEQMEWGWSTSLLYIWGHSFELRTEQDWERMEKLCAMLSHNDKVWYATNIEIYDYIRAQRRLQISADESIIHNPSAIEVCFQKDGKTYSIKGGETLFM